MITKKEFYFVRHGQTDCNLLGNKLDQPDVPLNAFGRGQAQKIGPLIASLNISAICFSPLKRAKETKDILSARLSAKEWEIPHLGECSLSVWQEMTSLGTQAVSSTNTAVRKFMQQVIVGINRALDKEGEVLIVAHGGIHWALCCLMSVEHGWVIDNCVPVHFSCSGSKWTTKRLV